MTTIWLSILVSVILCLGSNRSLDEIFIYKNFKLKNTSINEILGVIIDRELKFDKHVKHICKKAGNELNALTTSLIFSKKYTFQIFH